MNRRQIISAIVGAAILVGMFAAYILYNKHISERYGVYTIAKFIRYEGDPDGSTSVYEVHYNNKIYTINSSGGYYLTEGRFYFMKVIPYPNRIVNSSIHSAVPDCILQRPLPAEGWKEIPKCK